MGKSYGIDVAKLAGIPHDIISQARAYLDHFHSDSNTQGIITQKRADTDSVSLFSSTPTADSQVDHRVSKAAALIEEININNLTPIQAMQVVIKCREILQRKRS